MAAPDASLPPNLTATLLKSCPSLIALVLFPASIAAVIALKVLCPAPPNGFLGTAFSAVATCCVIDPNDLNAGRKSLTANGNLAKPLPICFTGRVLASKATVVDKDKKVLNN